MKYKISTYITIFSAITLVFAAFSVIQLENFISFAFSVALPFIVVVNGIIAFFWILKKSLKFLFPLFGLILIFILFPSFFQLNMTQQSNETDRILLLSYNVREFNEDNDISSEGIKEKILSFINSKNSDLICLQEYARIGDSVLENYDYKYISPQKNKSSLAVYSKNKILTQGSLEFSNSRNNAIFVDFEYHGELIRIYNVHLQSFGVELNSSKKNSNRYSRFFSKIKKAQELRLNQAQLIHDHIQKFKGNVIITGDFNSTQFTNVYKYLKDNRKDSFVEKGFGLGNTFELFNFPMRLDFILVDSKFNVKSHKNFNLNLSDHEPLLVQLELK